MITTAANTMLREVLTCEMCGKFIYSDNMTEHLIVEHGLDLCPVCGVDKTTWLELFGEEHHCADPDRSIAEIIQEYADNQNEISLAATIRDIKAIVRGKEQ